MGAGVEVADKPRELRYLVTYTLLRRIVLHYISITCTKGQFFHAQVKVNLEVNREVPTVKSRCDTPRNNQQVNPWVNYAC